MLFLFQMTIEYRGLSQPEVLKIWIQEAEVAMAAKASGLVKEIWKVVGERKVYVVIDAESAEKVDELSLGLPIMKEMGDQVQLEITPITAYHNFANLVHKSIGNEPIHPTKDTPLDTSKEGIFYWLKFQVGYTGMSQEELFRIWAEEAKFIMEAQGSGDDALNLWKSLGKREVHAILRVKTPEALDALSMDLPIMKKMGDQVQIECKSVRPYDGFYEELKKRVQSIS